MSTTPQNISLTLLAALALAGLTGCPETDPAPSGMADMGMMPVDENNTPGCSNTCLDGETQCLNELFVLTCEVQANGCRAFGKSAKRCGSGEMCNPSTSKCESSGGPTECVANCESGDSPRCNAQGEVETCALRDGMECFTYEMSMSCSGTDVCTKGECAAPVCEQAACTIDATQCEGELVQTCGMMNGCAVFGAATDCPDGQTCMGGSCQETSSCEDECIVGTDKLCAPGGVPRVCETSAEGCGKYVDLAACGGSDVCEKGECVADVSCPFDSCELPGARDCESGGVRECILAPGSDCGEWNVVEDCMANGFICNQASAFVQCEPPPMMTSPVVINEIFYNVPGPDVDANMEARSFIELRGAPGQSIENWEVRLVNGSNGMAYRTITLDPGATIGSNGTALLVTDKAVRFLDFQVFVGTNIVGTIPTSGNDDGIQNGPDNIELYDASGTKLDALGYGDFGMSDVFTGEGTSPGRIFENRSLGRPWGSPDTDDNSVDFLSQFPTPGDRNGDIFINEVYVDQPGTDGQADNIETFVELRAPIVDSNWINMELDQYNLRAVNGLNGMDYIFSGVLPGMDFSGARLHDAVGLEGGLSSEGLVLICNIDAVAPVLNRCSVPYEGVDFQNGPDSFVLEYQGRVIDAVGYGTFSGAEVNAGEGTSVTLSSSQAGKSLNRSNDAGGVVDTNDNATDFYLADPTPAAKNAQP